MSVFLADLPVPCLLAYSCFSFWHNSFLLFQSRKDPFGGSVLTFSTRRRIPKCKGGNTHVSSDKFTWVEVSDVAPQKVSACLLFYQAAISLFCSALGGPGEGCGQRN